MISSKKCYVQKSKVKSEARLSESLLTLFLYNYKEWLNVSETLIIRSGAIMAISSKLTFRLRMNLLPYSLPRSSFGTVKTLLRKTGVSLGISCMAPKSKSSLIEESTTGSSSHLSKSSLVGQRVGEGPERKFYPLYGLNGDWILRYLLPVL